jgi:TPR repeat protein
VRKLLLILTLLTFTSIASAEIEPELMQKAKQGDAKAQFTVGRLYAYGWGVPEDAKEAST